MQAEDNAGNNGKLVDQVSYIGEDRKGLFRFTIPSTWKITWGRATPGARPEYNDEKHNIMVLRVYRTQSEQKMVVPDVKWFRLESVNFQRPNVVREDAEWEDEDMKRLLAEKAQRALKDER